MIFDLLTFFIWKGKARGEYAPSRKCRRDGPFQTRSTTDRCAWATYRVRQLTRRRVSAPGSLICPEVLIYSVHYGCEKSGLAGGKDRHFPCSSEVRAAWRSFVMRRRSDSDRGNNLQREIILFMLNPNNDTTGVSGGENPLALRLI